MDNGTWTRKSEHESHARQSKENDDVIRSVQSAQFFSVTPGEHFFALSLSLSSFIFDLQRTRHLMFV